MIYYLTPEAFQQLKEELHDLKTRRRKEIVQIIQEAKDLGDLSENAAYQEAKEAQGKLENRIMELEVILKNASLIKKKKHSSDKVEIGSSVEIISLSTPKSKRTLTIVGSQEAKPEEGKISNESPLGKTLLGCRRGEVIVVNTPKGAVKYRILKIF